MKKESNQEHNLLEIKIPENATNIFQQVIEFLQLFLSVTLAKRFTAIILLAIWMPVILMSAFNCRLLFCDIVRSLVIHFLCGIYLRCRV